jgi:acyl carrier protein
MTNDEIFAVVKKHLIDICPDIAEESVSPEVSMKDLGASSLDMVEVVSCSMRELGVRVPRQELSSIKDIQGLADLLQTAMAAKG